MSTQPLLLCFPGELRNRIYEFVLSSPVPLHYRNAEIMNRFRQDNAQSPTCSTDNPAKAALISLETDTEFNQLKYVNKQLYAETAGLELKYNDIEVTRLYETCDAPATQLVDWVASMTRSKRCWLGGSSVVLSDDVYFNYHLDSTTSFEVERMASLGLEVDWCWRRSAEPRSVAPSENLDQVPQSLVVYLERWIFCDGRYSMAE